jgi:hypothetical protein
VQLLLMAGSIVLMSIRAAPDWSIIAIVGLMELMWQSTPLKQMSLNRGQRGRHLPLSDFAPTWTC